MEPERVRKLREAAMQALADFQALGPEATAAEQCEAATRQIGTTIDYLRALAQEPGPGAWALPRSERREVMQALLDIREHLRPVLPDAMAGAVRFAASDPNDLADGITRKEWQYARDALTDNGFLEPGELATFPVESLVAIALDRLRRWEETGDARG